MPDLTETTLAAPVTSSQILVPLTSATGINVGDVMFFDGEAVSVGGFTPTNSHAIVTRGYGGTTAQTHPNGAIVFAGKGHHFKTHDPRGVPLDFPYSNPWVNIRDNRVWRAQGDQVGPGVSGRYWQQVTLTRSTGDLGVQLLPVSAP